MESITNNQMLELTLRPAFIVRDGLVSYANRPALLRQVSVGDSVASMMTSGQEEYASFQDGCLCLPLTISNVTYQATIIRMDGQHVFMLDPEESAAELQALSLAAREIREPLDRILLLSESLFSSLESDPQTSKQISGINRGLYQLLRLVGNMSDAGNSYSRQELRDVTSVFQEIFDEAAHLCASTGITLTFTNYPKSVYSLIDSNRMERAIYNILSNSLKFTPTGGTIRAQLECRKKTLYLIISDSGPGIAFNIASHVFNRYCREPGIEDNRHGIGLGMSLIRSAVVAHGGTVLLDRSKEGGVRTTLSLPIQQNPTSLRSPILRIDYAGERNHGLIELSDSLPNHMYGPNTD